MLQAKKEKGNFVPNEISGVWCQTPHPYGFSEESVMQMHPEAGCRAERECRYRPGSKEPRKVYTAKVGLPPTHCEGLLKKPTSEPYLQRSPLGTQGKLHFVYLFLFFCFFLQIYQVILIQESLLKGTAW